jgi:hypothetical protein
MPEEKEDAPATEETQMTETTGDTEDNISQVDGQQRTKSADLTKRIKEGKADRTEMFEEQQPVRRRIGGMGGEGRTWTLKRVNWGGAKAGPYTDNWWLGTRGTRRRYRPVPKRQKTKNI